jgi:hypothetical protein
MPNKKISTYWKTLVRLEMDFFVAYQKLDKMIAQYGYSFREIKEQINPAKLKL